MRQEEPKAMPHNLETRERAAHTANISAQRWMVDFDRNTNQATLVAEVPTHSTSRNLLKRSMAALGVIGTWDGEILKLSEQEATQLYKAGVRGPAFEAIGPMRYMDTYRGTGR